MKIVGKILLALLVIILGGIGYWFYDREDRMNLVDPKALAALESDAAVTVTEDEYFVFRPNDRVPTTGVIFYPGGEVDERGYADPLRAIAEAGYLVVMVPMPLKLAIMGIDKASDVIEAYPDIQTWVIVGHSLGGSMAARYVFQNPDAIDGLLLWDAYAPDDMKGSNARIMMLHRSDESGSPPADYTPHLANLPDNTQFVPLVGGQHLNFGRFIAGRAYRDEPPAELPQDNQIELASKYSIEFIAGVEAAD